MSRIQKEQNTMLTAILNPKSDGELDVVTLRDLRNRSKQMDGAIQAVQSRINYMKNKQQQTIKKVINVKRKLTSLENVRNKAREEKHILADEQKRANENLQKKSEYNKLIKDHLKFNKKIVITLMNHKVNEDVKSVKEKNQQLKIVNNFQRQNIVQVNTQRANKVRFEHIQAHQKRKIYFLEKLKEFKSFKQQKLKQEIKQRQRQENIIQQLEQKQRVLLQRLSNSQRFRMRCQQQYQQAKQKYHSFYESSRVRSRGLSRQSSVEGKAQIFIS